MRTYLIDRRAEKNLTQQDVANQLGISRQYYSAIENGERQKKMEITLVAKLSTILELPISTIIENENII